MEEEDQKSSFSPPSKKQRTDQKEKGKKQPNAVDKLRAFLSNATESCKGDHDKELLMFKDYFERDFSSMNMEAMNLWVLLFRKANLSLFDDPTLMGKHQESNNDAKKTLSVENRKLSEPVDPYAGKLSGFLSNASESCKGDHDQELLLMFKDYFEHYFSSVPQLPWVGTFIWAPLEIIIDIPLCYVLKVDYDTSLDLIDRLSDKALEEFVLSSLEIIREDMDRQLMQKPGSFKSQVATLSCLAMVLRQKPDVLINIMPKLTTIRLYQGKDKPPFIQWMILQAWRKKLAVALYLWARLTLPILGEKPGSDQKSMDMVLQLVERILTAPKAVRRLVKKPVIKGERVMPPAALHLLLYVTFPAASARVKATKRFQKIYPKLKKVALADAPGSEATEQVSRQIPALVVKAAGKENSGSLIQEAADIFIWCLCQSSDCYKQWDDIYVDNIEFSVAILKKFVYEWKELSSKQSCLQVLAETLKSFMRKNEKALTGGLDVSRQGSFQDADKYCKTLA